MRIEKAKKFGSEWHSEETERERALGSGTWRVTSNEVAIYNKTHSLSLISAW